MLSNRAAAPAILLALGLGLMAAITLTASPVSRTSADSATASLAAAAPDATVVAAHATWQERYATVEDAVRASDQVVVAKVVGITPGRVVTAGGVFVPFTNIRLDVIDSAGSSLVAGSTFMLEQTGGATPSGPLVLQDDPTYVAGNTYVLLLRSIPGGWYRIVAPIGRFSVQAGKLVPADPYGVGTAWQGRAASDLMSVAKALRRN